MAEHTVVLKLNQQQLELLDRTVARGVAADREVLIKLALREYAAQRAKEAASAGAAK
jgi:metal-responsive CopG/Arc/MetJ family transcriptional regulator